MCYAQVFDLAQHRPDKVLAQIWENLKGHEEAGNAKAATVRRKLRLLVAGGDGTIAWVMKVVKQLNLDPQPPIAIMPLGTGNDLSRTFSWGDAFHWSWIRGHTGVYHTLKRVSCTRRWNVQ